MNNFDHALLLSEHKKFINLSKKLASLKTKNVYKYEKKVFACQNKIDKDTFDRKRLNRIKESPICQTLWKDGNQFEDDVNNTYSFGYNSTMRRGKNKIKRLSRRREVKTRLDFKASRVLTEMNSLKKPFLGNYSLWFLDDTCASTVQKLKKKRRKKNAVARELQWNKNSHKVVERFREPETRMVNRLSLARFSTIQALKAKEIEPKYYEEGNTRKYFSSSMVHSTTPRASVRKHKKNNSL